MLGLRMYNTKHKVRKKLKKIKNFKKGLKSYYNNIKRQQARVQVFVFWGFQTSSSQAALLDSGPAPIDKETHA